MIERTDHRGVGWVDPRDRDARFERTRADHRVSTGVGQGAERARPFRVYGFQLGFALCKVEFFEDKGLANARGMGHDERRSVAQDRCALRARFATQWRVDALDVDGISEAVDLGEGEMIGVDIDTDRAEQRLRSLIRCGDVRADKNAPSARTMVIAFITHKAVSERAAGQAAACGARGSG